MSSFLLFLGFIALINLSLAVFVFSRNPLSWVNRSFVLFVGTLSFWTICVGMLLTSKQLIWSDLTLFFGNLVGVSSFILFSKQFPEGQKLSLKYLLYFVILPIVIFLFLTPFHPFVSGVIAEGSQVKPVIGPLYPLLLLWSVFGAIFGGFLLFRKYRKSTGRSKIQLRYLFWGFISFLFTVTILSVILPALGIGRFAFFSPAASLLMVGMVSYAIMRHKLLDIRIVVVRSVVYSLLVLIYAMFYTADAFLISFYLFKNNITLAQSFIFAMLTIFIAFTFQPFRRLIEDATSDLFFKNAYKTNELISRLTKIMASTLRLESLTKDTLHELLQTIHISRGAFVILRDKDGIYPVISEGFEKEPGYNLDFVRDFASRKRIYVLEDEEDEHIKQLMRDVNLTVILPLFEDDHVQGVLLLGEKLSGEIYSQQDIQVLEIFGPEISVAVQNAKAYEEISRFNLTLKDEVDKATKDLQYANERLKELDKLKDEFVSIASHELRTPMTAIRSYLWMALAGQGGELNEKQHFYIQRGYNSVERLIKLVNDMLNVSRIESGRISLEMQKIDMTTLVEEVRDEVVPRADELGLHIKIDDATIPPSVLADPDKIKEVIFNLIGNSLKFTPKDGTITISFVEKDGMVETKISDTGAGIDKENIPNLFHKFGILPGSYTSNQSAMGTGLGLYICKSIIELHDGKIWAESQGKDKGTTFAFTLPVFSDERLAAFHEKHKDDHQEHVGLEHTEL